MKKIILIISAFLHLNINAQLITTFKDSGIVFSNDLTSNEENIYIIGNYKGQVHLNNETLKENEFNTPFLIKYSIQTNQSLNISPIQNINGFAEFKSIKIISDKIIISCIFSNLALINGDTVGKNNEWNNVIIALNLTDSVLWHYHSIIPINKSNNIYISNGNILGVETTNFEQLVFYKLNSETGEKDWNTFICQNETYLNYDFDEDNYYLITKNSNFKKYTINKNNGQIISTVTFKVSHQNIMSFFSTNNYIYI